MDDTLKIDNSLFTHTALLGIKTKLIHFFVNCVLNIILIIIYITYYSYKEFSVRHLVSIRKKIANFYKTYPFEAIALVCRTQNTDETGNVLYIFK
jgi:hypothetical protein